MGRDQGTLPAEPAATSWVQPLATARTRRLLMRHLRGCTCPSQAVPPGHVRHLRAPDPEGGLPRARGRRDDQGVPWVATEQPDLLQTNLIPGTETGPREGPSSLGNLGSVSAQDNGFPAFSTDRPTLSLTCNRAQLPPESAAARCSREPCGRCSRCALTGWQAQQAPACRLTPRLLPPWLPTGPPSSHSAWGPVPVLADTCDSSPRQAWPGKTLSGGRTSTSWEPGARVCGHACAHVLPAAPWRSPPFGCQCNCSRSLMGVLEPCAPFDLVILLLELSPRKNQAARGCSAQYSSHHCSRLGLPPCPLGTPPAPGRGSGRHLGVVGGGVLGHCTLLLHQEAEPPPLLRERRLVAVGHVVLQLALLAADGVNVLRWGRGRGQVSWWPTDWLKPHIILAGRQRGPLTAPLPLVLPSVAVGPASCDSCGDGCTTRYLYSMTLNLKMVQMVNVMLSILTKLKDSHEKAAQVNPDHGGHWTEDGAF